MNVVHTVCKWVQWFTYWGFALILLIPHLSASGTPVEVLRHATFESLTGIRDVTLPHAMSREDFAPEGSRVRYRMTLEVTDPSINRGIYIQKMSRTGRVLLNGYDIGSCGHFELEESRCQHRPQFFETDTTQWRKGTNILEVELFTTYRLTNGLSEVWVGPEKALFYEVYWPRYTLQVTSIEALSWLTLALGLVSLFIFFVLGNERLYLWYGITCLLNVVSNMNVLVTNPSMSLLFFDWIIFASRLVFNCTLGLTYLVYFERDNVFATRGLLGYAALASLLIWIFDSDPRWITLLYLPLMGVSFLLTGASIRWAWQSGRTRDWVMASTFCLMPLAGVLDFIRLDGGGPFTGVYILNYFNAITLFLMGVSMFALLAWALQSSKNMAVILNTKLQEREAELDQSYQQLLATEKRHARSEERGQLLRDMHDGFLSTLSVTRLALMSGKIDVPQARQQISDCMDDLRLMLETSANDSGKLDEVLVDYCHRIELRLESSNMELDLQMNLAQLPVLPSSTLLQIMRIVQEALNNAVRHAQATHIMIDANWQPAQQVLTLAVKDNGHGIHTDNPNRGGGRGLGNMQARAKALDGTLHVTSDTQGTCVCLQAAIAQSVVAHPSQ